MKTTLVIAFFIAVMIGAHLVTGKEGAAITYKKLPQKKAYHWQCVDGVVYLNLGRYVDYPSYTAAFNTDGTLKLCEEE